jgi:hypothetical protein
VQAGGEQTDQDKLPATACSFPAARWILLLLVLGVGWRLLRYALCFPFWGDEAYLNLSILHRGYAELLAPLEYAQIAPLLFLWIQRTAHLLFGGGEYALRAFSLLAGVSALLLFARLAWQQLKPVPATIAIGIFASTYALVRHTCESKPYGGDLLAATVLLWVAARWLRERDSLRRAGLAAATAAVLIWLSYPAAFVAGGISLTLLVTNIRVPTRRAWACWAFYAAVIAGSFVVYFLVFVAPPAERAAGSWLAEYWADAFPPLHGPGALLWWLVKTHTGRMMAYPLGSSNFASSLTTLLCAAGVVALVRQRRRSSLLLWLAPVLPTLVAAALHRYPYGDSVRVSIHLAPGICALAGVGVAALVNFASAARTRATALGLVLGVLACIPVGGAVRDVLAPYKAWEEEAGRCAMRDLAGRIGPDAAVAIYNPPEGTHGPPDGPAFYQTLRYYLELYTGVRPRWRTEGGLDATTVWLLVYRGPHYGPDAGRVQEVAAAAGLALTLEHEYFFSKHAPTSLAVYRCKPVSASSVRGSACPLAIALL